MNLNSVLTVKDLPAPEKKMLEDLLTVWQNKLVKNRERVKYYDGKNPLKDLGIAIPPMLKNLNAVIGWPAKAVDSLAVRSRFNGCVFSDGQDHGIKEILDANMFENIYYQAARLVGVTYGVHDPLRATARFRLSVLSPKCECQYRD